MGPLFEQTQGLDDNISTVYTQDFVQLDELDSVQKAVQALRMNKSVIICSDNRPVGILTETDILKLTLKSTRSSL